LRSFAARRALVTMSRKLSVLEQRIHQAALAAPKMTLSQKEVDTLAPDATARLAAVNFLLATGLFKLLKDTKGHISYRTTPKQEIEVKKDLGAEENLVLSHIQAAANEGIWTKHLKAKTELHQTVIDRCLKSLVQKQLIKSVKSVKHPTRKVYMLFHLEPSVDVTGGPWYTDNELDTEFIKLLCSAILRFIKDRSFPKTKSENRPLYAISAAPSYPTGQQIQTFLSKSKITETQLTVEHIEMLLNVLVIDGEIEKVPAFAAALWDANTGDASESEEEEKKEKAKKKKKKRKKADVSSDSDSDEQDRKRRKKKKKKVKEESDSDEEVKPKSKKSRSKSKRRRSPSSSESESEDSASESESESEAESKRSSKKRSRKNSSTHRESSETAPEEDYGGAFVYRAIKHDQAASGWSQAPCGHCPQFDFCDDRGLVNPRDCEYYTDWLKTVPVKME